MPHYQLAQAAVGAHRRQQPLAHEGVRQLIVEAGQLAQVRVGRQRVKQQAKACIAQVADRYVQLLQRRRVRRNQRAERGARLLLIRCVN
jgi:hypothetical protein